MRDPYKQNKKGNNTRAKYTKTKKESATVSEFKLRRKHKGFFNGNPRNFVLVQYFKFVLNKRNITNFRF